jgi:hypothetical protein
MLQGNTCAERSSNDDSVRYVVRASTLLPLSGPLSQALKFADKRRSLGWYISLADSSHAVAFYVSNWTFISFAYK